MNISFDNIAANDGLSIAATGMIIVFATLTLISTFIYLLPIVLRLLAPWLPDDPQPAAPAPNSPFDDPELVAAIGFALHQRQQRKH